MRLHFLKPFEAKKEKKIMQPTLRLTRSYLLRRVEPRVSASEDEADVEKELAGEVSAFENIVRRWQGPLVNLAHRFCRDRSRAEEMAQDAFLRAYRALRQWRKDAVFSTWLFAVATNLYRSELRRIPAQTLSIEHVAIARGGAGFKSSGPRLGGTGSRPGCTESSADAASKISGSNDTVLFS
jgi:hypothetical protein